jgi:glycosyltransferase involved in cell wall biosynthesis
MEWSDVFLQNNISLRTLWPLLFVRRPLFITHQTWITGAEGEIGWLHRLKRWVLRFAKSLAISEAVARRLPVESTRVGNPYDDAVFNAQGSEARARELIFVGRLVSDKGADILLQALARLRGRGIKPQLTIVGDGPERPALERQCADLHIQASVEFVGSFDSGRLAETLRQHRILVVPSRWPEPFGIVAIEAIASGCVVVGSDQGGLPEAIGPCGVTFPNGDAEALAERLQELLSDPARSDALRRGAPEHLHQFSRAHVAQLYLRAMAPPA